MNRHNDNGSERKREAAERSARRLVALGLPADANCRLPIVTISGSGYVKVEHHMGVLQLGNCCVRLYSCLGVIRIEGRGLAAARMDADVMLLEGRIVSVCFE